MTYDTFRPIRSIYAPFPIFYLSLADLERLAALIGGLDALRIIRV